MQVHRRQTWDLFKFKYLNLGAYCQNLNLGAYCQN